MSILKVADFSEFQTVTSWSDVKKNVDAVILRMGLRRDSGSIRYDNKFKQFLSGVKAYKIPYGVYFFPTAINAKEATEEVEWILEKLRDYELTLSLPLYLDSENVWINGKAGRANGLPVADRTKYLKIIVDRLERNGIPCGIYASTSWLNSKIDMKQFSIQCRANTWVAQYASKCEYTGSYAMWQYTSKASVPGVNTGGRKEVDVSKVVGTFAMNVSYYKTTSPVQISNSGSDERGKYSGGTAGDQTGNEWRIRDWYNRPWNCVLRHPDPQVRATFTKLEIEAANNDKIGYDQSQRTTYWTELKKVDYKPPKIKTPCEADCSAGVIANAKAVGYILGIDKLKNIAATYTGNMRNDFKKAGFNVLTDPKYLTTDKYLIAGDILLNDAHHVAAAVSNGLCANVNYISIAKTTEKEEYKMPEIQHGSEGRAVKVLQVILGGLTIDGDFGAKTKNAVLKFQKANGLTADGIVGPKTWTKLLSTL